MYIIDGEWFGGGDKRVEMFSAFSHFLDVAIDIVISETKENQLSKPVDAASCGGVEVSFL